MKWLIRLAALVLAIDLAAGLFGVSIGFRGGGGIPAGYWTPARILTIVGLAACCGAWAWLTWRAFRTPWSAPIALVGYEALRLAGGAALALQLGSLRVEEILALNAAPLLVLPVVLLALWKPPKEPDLESGPA